MNPIIDNPIIDPRLGDVEDDTSSTKQRSLLAIAGSLLAEVNLPRLALAWIVLIILPGILLGIAPLIVSAWFGSLSRAFAASLGGVWAFTLLALAVGFGWLGGRPLVRAAERGFWSLNSLAVQPGYALCREGLRHLVELRLAPKVDARRLERLRAATALGAGFVACGFGLCAAALAWPSSRWIGEVVDLTTPHRLIVPALANTIVLLGSYSAVAALLWGIADATMQQPRDLASFALPSGRPTWRIAHLSDLHVVGERYGFRIESGRGGPRGNNRLARVLARLDEIHANNPIDIILVTGDVTDAGRSAEWAEFFTALDRHPRLAERMLLLPGNHDVNVVDRANPARLDLPLSPGKRLRQMRALSAIAAVQGDRVRVVDPTSGQLGDTLSVALAPHRAAIAAFADAGTMRLSSGLAKIWAEAFPMVLQPSSDDGLGVVLLNSNAETHFSFTNALGLVPAEQAHGLAAVICQFPRARWVVALHHHLVEYPKPAKAFSERIGTALINGSWFLRQLRPLEGRAVAMHGHRHIDWIGECGGIRIVSAPSPVMEAKNDAPTHFYLHTLGADSGGRLCMMPPERVDIAGETAAS
ncbi:metallophosphoesterase family protein [Microvirga alba]|uniref:Metallophosphoesterase n=1 Tax=Microvirga alba TaxID=2791025 RepID=A0A931BNL7_9HYPH|nr:metallophosphoesterase [Microvirga alba]MBF9233263.1 metallophosphoesterase [Microvirga alba]